MTTPRIINVATRQRGIAEAQAISGSVQRSRSHHPDLYRAKVTTVNSTTPVTYRVRLLSGSSDTETGVYVDSVLSASGATFAVGDTVILHTDSPEPPTLDGLLAAPTSDVDEIWQDFPLGCQVPIGTNAPVNPGPGWPLVYQHVSFANHHESPNDPYNPTWQDNSMKRYAGTAGQEGDALAMEFFIPYLPGSILTGLRFSARVDTTYWPPTYLQIQRYSISDPYHPAATGNPSSVWVLREGQVWSYLEHYPTLDPYKPLLKYDSEAESTSSNGFKVFEWDDLRYKNPNWGDPGAPYSLTAPLTLAAGYVYTVLIKMSFSSRETFDATLTSIGLCTSKRVR